MKPIHIAGAASILLFVEIQVADAQWATGQAANVILGQKGPNSTASGLSAEAFSTPTGIALDLNTRKLFVADRDNNRILRWTPTADTVTGSAAEAVFGQVDFASGGGLATRSGLNAPTALAVDPGGRLFVVDAANNRVLRFDNASSKPTGAEADAVFGQPDFLSKSPALTRTGMNNPQGVAVDSAGHLFVADRGNHRVLRFDNVATKPNGAEADAVLGQPDFTTARDTTSRSGMSAPHGLAVDPSGALLVAVRGSNRVLKFDAASTKANGANADLVLGQPDFSSRGAATSATGLNEPISVTVDFQGQIFVNDFGNNRCVWFSKDSLTSNGPKATGAVGQKNLTSNNQGASLEQMRQPWGITVHPKNPSLWICDAGNNRVLHFSQATPTGVEEALGGEVPTGYMLEQNYPNPFNPSTIIRYGLPVRSRVNVAVYDALGQRVALLVDGEQDGGMHSIAFDASGLSSGVYFYRLSVVRSAGADLIPSGGRNAQGANFMETKKLMVLR